jgi:hypothetical protein
MMLRGESGWNPRTIDYVLGLHERRKAFDVIMSIFICWIKASIVSSRSSVKTGTTVPEDRQLEIKK